MQTSSRQPVTETADFRTYAPEILDEGDGRVTVTRLCEDLVGGRWEPFYSYVSPREAATILQAAGYDLSAL